MPTPETFDLQATVNAVLHALHAVICTIGFQVAIAGFFVACVIAVLGLISLKRGKPAGKPLLAVFSKLSIFCTLLVLPGAFTLLTQGQLPQVNQLVLNPFGLVCFWGLVTAHLCMEEMNFQWYLDK